MPDLGIPNLWSVGTIPQEKWPQDKGVAVAYGDEQENKSVALLMT